MLSPPVVGGLATMEITEEALRSLRQKLQFKVRYYLGPWSPDVEDVVQETITRLLRSARDEGIRNPESWAAFASATCNNVIHEHRRSFWRETSGVDGVPERATRGHGAAVEAHDLVTRSLTELCARDQELLRGFYFEEKSPEQICTEMGLSPGSFRVALFRAKERFRRTSQSLMKPNATEPH
jgi:RNA polymerase sigma factor (sigma-70 family)